MLNHLCHWYRMILKDCARVSIGKSEIGSDPVVTTLTHGEYTSHLLLFCFCLMLRKDSNSQVRFQLRLHLSKPLLGTGSIIQAC